MLCFASHSSSDPLDDDIGKLKRIKDGINLGGFIMVCISCPMTGRMQIKQGFPEKKIVLALPGASQSSPNNFSNNNTIKNPKQKKHKKA
jgi:hypothetical protein